MKRGGFTFIETAIAVGILMILGTFATVNVIHSARKASLTQVVEILISDMRAQQAKAMTGYDRGSTSPQGYGVYFESDQYVLFAGSVYNPADSSNIVVPVSAPIIVTDIQFPSSSVVFEAKSGDVVGYTSGLDTVTLRQDTDGQTQTIRLNRFGTIISVN